MPEIQKPRVRIAPSPTGDPHVGTAYVGLFNMVFARARGGSFILRIEDTDRQRSTEESEQAILDSLRWVGLRWDEGPDVGGPCGPYRQSERAAIYREHAELLIARGAAYRCFCTAERLQELRAKQREAGGRMGYDGRCRALDPAEARARAEAGEGCVVRLKMAQAGETVFRDLLRGMIHYPNEQMDDQVLLKSDGYPTYHLANVVDDHLMGITHVIRAEEWIPSTPKHLRLYEAFGWEPPVFVHLSLLRNADKSKISKRKNPVSLEWYREAGILPEALLNFLGLMGWSMPDDREKFTVEEMIAEFSAERLKVSEPVFDLKKLEWLNGLWIRGLDPGDLRDRLASFLTGPKLDALIPLVQERLPRLDGFTELTSYFYTMDVELRAEDLRPRRWPGKAQDGDDEKAPYRAMNVALKELLAEIEALPAFGAEALETLHRDYCARTGWKARDLFSGVRNAVSGRKATPPLFDTMVILGKARVQHRLRAAVELLRAAIRR